MPGWQALVTNLRYCSDFHLGSEVLNNATGAKTIHNNAIVTYLISTVIFGRSVDEKGDPVFWAIVILLRKIQEANDQSARHFSIKLINYFLFTPLQALSSFCIKTITIILVIARLMLWKILSLQLCHQKNI